MANTKSARKAAKQSEKRRVVNLARKTAVKSSIKKVHAAIAEGLDAAQIQKLLSDAAAQLARAKSKKVLHANTASRKLSRLAQKVNASNKA